MGSSGIPPAPPPTPYVSAPSPADHQESDFPVSSGREPSSSNRSKRPSLKPLQIPARYLDSTQLNTTDATFLPTSTPGSIRAGLPPRPTSTRGKTFVRSLLPQWSFSAKNNSQEGDKTNLLLPSISSQGQRDSSSISRAFSLSKVFSGVTLKGTHSLPVTPFGNQGAGSSLERHVVDIPTPGKTQDRIHMGRSLSAPGNAKGRSLRRADSLGLIE
ncbi:hypothetical protein HPP92_002162 [Vanilla planifolia]|uniref:Uncharacterized protein n=1 Tax=Vanilla planifolia TaxID=51239 RepID=A0A835VI87_VANPL|nr:hypothetical protein HPP92_002162 [Vanilla planifolia]